MVRGTHAQHRHPVVRVVLLCFPLWLAAVSGLLAAAALAAPAARAAAPGDRLWTRIAPATTRDASVAAVVPAPTDGVYTVATKASGHGSVLIVSRLSSSGHLLWSRAYGGPVPANPKAYGRCAVLDHSGALIVGGGLAHAGHSQDFLIVKYSSAGKRLWLRYYDGPAKGFDRLSGVGVDAAGNAYAAGTATVKSGGSNYMLVKFRAGDGAPQWRSLYSGPLRNDHCEGMAVTPAGISYLTGYSMYLVAGSGEKRSAAATLKVSRRGERAWARREKSPNGSVYAYHVLATPGGGCYASGSYEGSPSEDAMLLTYSAGGVRTARGLVDANGLADQGFGMALAPSGDIILCGSAFGPDYSNLLVARVTPQGAVDWVRQFGGGTTNGEFNDVTCDATGAVYATGDIYNGSAEDLDLCTVKYSATGIIEWANVFSGPGHHWDWGRTIAATPTSVFVGGFTESATAVNDGLAVRYQP